MVKSLSKLALNWRRMGSRIMPFWLGIGLALAMNWNPSTPTFAQETSAALWQQASFPVENFQAYTSAFGHRTSPTGSVSSEFHYGLDIAAPQGSYVRNWWVGKVIEVSDHTSCGTSTVIQSGQWEHRYCHMNGHVEERSGMRYLVDRDGDVLYEQGQDLPTGTRLGRVGMTGRTTGPHLHWMLKYDGSWVAPGLVLRAMYEAQRTG